jgi:RNase P subunit RPR2
VSHPELPCKACGYVLALVRPRRGKIKLMPGVNAVWESSIDLLITCPECGQQRRFELTPKVAAAA